MKHSNSAIQHLDGTMYASKVSSHYKQRSIVSPKQFSSDDKNRDYLKYSLRYYVHKEKRSVYMCL